MASIDNATSDIKTAMSAMNSFGALAPGACGSFGMDLSVL